VHAEVRAISALLIECRLPIVITEAKASQSEQLCRAAEVAFEAVHCILQELGVDVTPRLQTVKVEEPPKRKGGIMVSSIEELVDKLKNEAKVL
jgi:electron transfer flavoprotein alpha/beta subunit